MAWGLCLLCLLAPTAARDQWMGWTEEQRRRRLALVVNNCRFLFLPDKSVPDFGSRSLRLVLERLSADWQARYGHSVLVVEAFVDTDSLAEQFTPLRAG